MSRGSRPVASISVWDLLAARRARALGIGMLSGGYGEEELERAGAYRVYENPRDLLRHLDEIGVRAGAQEGPLTGKSVPENKEPREILAPDTALGDRRNMAYLGTVVAAGKTRAMVVATGVVQRRRDEAPPRSAVAAPTRMAAFGTTRPPSQRAFSSGTSRSAGAATFGHRAPRDEAARTRILALHDALADQGFRVLGIAYNEMSRDHPRAVVDDEVALTLCGFAAFLDPPKADAGCCTVVRPPRSADPDGPGGGSVSVQTPRAVAARS